MRRSSCTQRRRRVAPQVRFDRRPDRAPRQVALSSEELAALRSELESAGFEIRPLGPMWWMAISDGEIYAEAPRELARRLRQLRSIQTAGVGPAA